MWKGCAPPRIGEGFLGLQPQTVTGNNPADALYELGADQPGGGLDGQQGFTATRCDCGKDVTRVARPGCDGLDDPGELSLMRAKGTLGQEWSPGRKR